MFWSGFQIPEVSAQTSYILPPLERPGREIWHCQHSYKSRQHRCNRSVVAKSSPSDEHKSSQIPSIRSPAGQPKQNSKNSFVPPTLITQPPLLRQQFSIWWGKLLYSYFNWRKDTWNDLQLFVLLNLLLLCLGAGFRNILTNAFSENTSAEGAGLVWHNVYEILVVVLGQELPDMAASGTAQIFSIIVAAVGLGSFALVLALVEQVVLQVLDANVRQGGKVYEMGHTLVLSLADSQRDQEVILKILSQACLAHRGEATPHTVVVLCQREKLLMEAAFRRSLPEEKRFGTQFVFRQGLPLIPESLRQVSASQAAAIVVISDSSRSPEEADAEAVRVAVLLDELDFPGFDKPDTRTGHIIVEVKTPDAKELIEYSCSKRVIALPTGQFNAKRIAQMVCQPVVGMVSQQLWSFHSESQCYLQPVSDLRGKRLSEAHRRFTRGLILGVYDSITKKTELNPPVSRKLKSRDMLVMMRPTSVGRNDYKPMEEAVPVDMGGWTPTEYIQGSGEEPVAVLKSHDDVEQRLAGFSAQMCRPGKNGKMAPQCTGLYMLPLEYTSTTRTAEKVLISGWGNSIFMLDLLKALDENLPPGSEVTLFNMRVTDSVMGAIRSEAELRSIKVLGVRGDPLKIKQLRRRLDVTDYKCAIILCDQSWQDPDLDLSNGLDLISEADTLRLDALVMTVQLNIRKLLEEAGFPDINLISEKLAFEGVTRFEDRKRLPMGICVNLTAYAAKLCFQVAYNPMILAPYAEFSRSAELVVQDSSNFCAEGELISFWQLQGRCLSVGQTLIGSYEVPQTVDSPIQLAVNPWGLEERNRQFAWNKGDGRRKILTLVDKFSWQKRQEVGQRQALNTGWKTLLATAPQTGKIEMGQLETGQVGSEGILWVPQSSRSTPIVKGPTYWDPLDNLDEAWRCQDPNGRLLDDLSSKEDHVAKLEAQQRAMHEN